MLTTLATVILASEEELAPLIAPPEVIAGVAALVGRYITVAIITDPQFWQTAVIQPGIETRGFVTLEPFFTIGGVVVVVVVVVDDLFVAVADAVS